MQGISSSILFGKGKDTIDPNDDGTDSDDEEVVSTKREHQDRLKMKKMKTKTMFLNKDNFVKKAKTAAITKKDESLRSLFLDQEDVLVAPDAIPSVQQLMHHQIKNLVV